MPVGHEVVNVNAQQTDFNPHLEQQTEQAVAYEQHKLSPKRYLHEARRAT